jgi:hypothetical protein
MNSLLSIVPPELVRTLNLEEMKVKGINPNLKEINIDLPIKTNSIINDYTNWFRFWVNIKNSMDDF